MLTPVSGHDQKVCHRSRWLSPPGLATRAVPPVVSMRSTAPAKLAPRRNPGRTSLRLGTRAPIPRRSRLSVHCGRDYSRSRRRTLEYRDHNRRLQQRGRRHPKVSSPQDGRRLVRNRIPQKQSRRWFRPSLRRRDERVHADFRPSP